MPDTAFGNPASPIKETLRRIALFSSLDDARLNALATRSSIQTYRPEDLIVREGEVGRAMFVILAGDVTVFRELEDQLQVRIADLGSGDCFGEQSMIPGPGRLRSASVKALNEVTCLAIGKDVFLDTIGRRSELLSEISRMGHSQLLHQFAQESALFHGINLGRDIDHWLTEKTFRAGEIVFRENDPGDSLYLILWGTARVSKAEHGQEITLGYLGAGRYFGELALINDEPRMATVTAESELLTLALAGKKFRALYANNPQLRTQLDYLSGVYRLPGKGFITMHPSKFREMDALTTIYHDRDAVQLAFTKVSDCPIFSIAVVAHGSTTSTETVRFESTSDGIIRELRLDNGRIVSGLFVGLWDDLGYVLETALLTRKLRLWQKALFITEGDLRLDREENSLSDDTVVCKCTGVTRGQLIRCMASGCVTVNDLVRETGAARVCGSCGPLLAELVGHRGLEVATIIEKINVTSEVKSFRLKPRTHTVPSYRLGRHIAVEAQIDGDWVRRSYTLTSSSFQTDYYEITVKREPKGLFSRWLHDRQHDTDVLRVSEPRGGYDLPEHRDTVIFFVAGIGITPALAFLRSPPRYHITRVHLDIAAKTRKAIPYLSEIEQARSANPMITVSYRISSEGCRLHDADVRTIAAQNPGAAYVICGPPQYESQVSAQLAIDGIPADQIQVERFSRPAGSAISSQLTAHTSSMVIVVAALLLCAAVTIFSPTLDITTVQGSWHLRDWLDDTILRQLSGYTILGVSVVSALVGVRKHLEGKKLGNYAWWRLGHMALGTSALGILYLHTGFSFGESISFVLMSCFVLLAAVGGLSMGLTLAQSRYPELDLYAWQSRMTAVHIAAMSALPALLTVHIVSGYYF